MNFDYTNFVLAFSYNFLSKDQTLSLLGIPCNDDNRQGLADWNCGLLSLKEYRKIIRSVKTKTVAASSSAVEDAKQQIETPLDKRVASLKNKEPAVPTTDAVATTARAVIRTIISQIDIYSILRDGGYSTSAGSMKAEDEIKAKLKEMTDRLTLGGDGKKTLMGQQLLDETCSTVETMEYQLEGGTLDIVTYLNKCVELRNKIGTRVITSGLVCPFTQMDL